MVFGGMFWEVLGEVLGDVLGGLGKVWGRVLDVKTHKNLI